MKPTLNRLGRKQNIVAVIVEGKNGEQQHIYDQEVFGFMNEEDKADFTTAVENPLKRKEIIDTLNAHLEDSERYLQELKNRIAETVINIEGLPSSFEVRSLQLLVEEYRNHKTYIEGVAASIELVNELNSEEPSIDDEEEDLKWIAKTLSFPQK
ncbi:hypothetical protein D1B33_18065 [Lysinibacillus yapensis]|uniref:Uncharacterized protein n=1 Tax=Ureibacillus yapensis TaxID=2304605 RepID=A0A396S2K3_9BACL|nr:hypothetical protein [Lysinibacillus yapensis]RHW31113.1 hypothetical protein D1B33_18065 [Lysinibacillus yapensis]